MQHRKYLIILFSMVLVGCSILLEQSRLITPTVSDEIPALPTVRYNTNEPDSTTAVTLSLLPTLQADTPSVAKTDTPSVSRSPTLTIPTETRLEHRCLEIQPDLPADGIYSGNIVLTSDQNPTYLMDISSGDMLPLLGEDKRGSFDEAVSPDRKWLAYTTVDPVQLVVGSLNEEQSWIKIPWGEDWFRLIGWINDQDLLVSQNGGSVIAISPFSGKQSHFDPLPDYDGSPGGWLEQYNPQLTRVVYPRKPDKNGNYIALWNVQSQETIATIQSYAGIGPYGIQPVWSPAGDAFIMSLFQNDPGSINSWYTELYHFSQDGEQHKITNLRPYYTEYLFIREYQWSPDESLVAFWLRYSKDDQSVNQLAILDMRTYQITNYCIEDRWGTSRELVWSPDSRQIIVNARYGDKPAVLLLDLRNQTAFRLAGDFTAVGWMDTSP